MEEYQIIVRVDPRWLKGWDKENLLLTTEERLKLWIEIQTAGTSISVESVSKIEEDGHENRQ